MVQIDLSDRKVKELKALALAAGLTGTSNLKKDELAEAIVKSRDGRIAVYNLQDREFAENALQTVLTTRFFQLPKPVAPVKPEFKPAAPVSDEEIKLDSFAALRTVFTGTVENEEATKAYEKAMKDYDFQLMLWRKKVRNIKDIIKSDAKYKDVKWNDTPERFYLTLAYRKAA